MNNAYQLSNDTKNNFNTSKCILRNKTRQQITIKIQIFITINNSIKNGVTKRQCNKQQLTLCGKY